MFSQAKREIEETLLLHSTSNKILSITNLSLAKDSSFQENGVKEKG
jgi:hypothetical protein